MNRVNSTTYIKRGASMPTGLDVIGTCFDKDVIANVASAFYQYLNDESINDLALETDREKCLMTITFAKQYIDAIFSIDPLKVAADAMSHVDIHTIKLSFLSGNIKTEESSVTRVGISTFLNNEKYFNAFVKLYNISKEQQAELINFLKTPHSDENSIPDFIMNEDRLRDLGVFMNASLLEMEIEKSAKNSLSNQQFIKIWKASKYAVECFPQEYQLWDASTKNKADQVLLLGQRTPMDKQDKDEIFYASALNAFLCYYTLYDNKGKSLIFENDVKEICKDPMRTAKFIEFLKNYEYGSLFCSEYAKYVEETGITPMFALDAIEPKPLVLTVDNNKEHKDWFLAVDNKLFKDNNNATKYESLSKLYSCLVEKGWIDADTPKTVFIYRFSGLDTPADLSNDSTIKIIKCPYKKLKELVDHLYYREERPPYKAFLRFFDKDTNLSSYKSKTEDVEEIKSIFKKCGLNWHPVER